MGTHKLVQHSWRVVYFGIIYENCLRLPRWLSGSAGNVGDMDLIPGSGIGNHLCSCLENPMDRRAWQATVHGWDTDWHNWVRHKRAQPQWLKFFDWANFSWYLLIYMHISHCNTQAPTAESTLTKKRKSGEKQLSCRAIIEAVCLGCGNDIAKLLSWELHLAL